MDWSWGSGEEASERRMRREKKKTTDMWCTLPSGVHANEDPNRRHVVFAGFYDVN